MSEYQYYQFIAIDRPLTQKELSEVRALSTRAEITPTSFTNEYHWGSFKGDPRKMMQRYYDLHVYYANWGTVRWMIRLPRAVADINTWEAYVTEETLNLTPSGQYVLLELSTLSSEEPDDYIEESIDFMSSVMQLRTDLIAGDLRVLYLGWLANIILSDEAEEDDDANELEPPVPPGLQALTPALKQYCDAFHVDADLLAAAAQASAPMKPVDEQGLQQWIAQLPAGEKDQMLLDLARGERPGLGAELRSRFARTHTPAATQAPKRTVGELLQLAQAQRENRKAAAAERAAEQRQRKEAQRKDHLQRIAANPDPIWEQARALIKETNRESYKQAAQLLADLRDAAAIAGASAAFASKLHELLEQHRSKSALREVLRAAHLV